jgi:cyclophilin family peptidyl-prolyl cis-trans isomerase
MLNHRYQRLQSASLLAFGIVVLSVMATVVSSCKQDSQPERLRRFAAAQQAAEQSSSIVAKTSEQASPDTLTQKIAANDTLPVLTHRVLVRTTKGAFTLGLYGKNAPKTVENFVKLAERKFYRGVLVHRIAKDFVIQTGDPRTKDKRKRDEWGNGGESAFGEPFETELLPTALSVKRGYKRGTVAMANRGPESNTSQFFICLRDIADLPLQYTIFGEVLDGMSVIDSIAAQKIVPVLNENDGRPVKAIVITNVNVSKSQRRR